MHGLYRYPKKYIESSLSEVTFDLRQSALKPQKHSTAETIAYCHYISPYGKEFKQIVMDFHRKSASAENNFQNSSNHILQKR